MNMHLQTKNILICILLLPFFSWAQFTKNKDSVLNILRSNKKEDTVKVIDYARVSQAYNHQKPDSAIYYLTKGITLANKLNFQRGIALLNSKLGTFYLDDGSYKKSDSVFRIALSIHRKLKRYEDQSMVLQSLSAVYSEAGDEVNSLKYILAGKEVAEKYSLVEQLSFCNGMIGISYLNQGDIANALKYLKEGIRISENLQHHHKFSTEGQQYYNLTVQADLCSNIAAIFADKKMYPEALRYYEKAIKTSRDGGFYDVNVLLFINAAEVYRKIDDKTKAKTLLDTALVLANQGNLYREKYKIYTQLGMLESRPKRAQVYFDQAIHMATAQKTDLMEIYDDISSYKSSHGLYKEAFEALQKYNILKDSVSGIEKAKQIANLKSVNQLQQSEFENKNLSLENYNVKLNSIIITVISILLVGVIIAGYFYYKKRKKLHALVSLQKTNLEELNNVKDRIFYIVGHDLRGPVSSLNALTELMEIEFGDHPGISEYISLLKTKQSHALEILDKLLTWGKLEFQESSTKTTFRVLSALGVTLQGITSGALQKNIVFENTIPEDLEVRADANHFDFIIRNLLQNALKFTPSTGTITLSYCKDDPKRYHVFKIKDSGIGITEDKLSKLMKSGAMSTPGTSNETGTGIGLMLVKKIADQNNQIITVESKIGQGTTFYYRIPFSS